MAMEIPEADPVALARMTYAGENMVRKGMTKKAMGIFRKSPDTTHAAKSGTPAMERSLATIPASVPQPAPAGTGVTDVTISTTNSSALDTKPDARQNPPVPDAAKP